MRLIRLKNLLTNLWKMTIEKKEEIKNLMRFIMDFNGELTLRKNKIYNCGKVIAIFKGNKAYIGEKYNEKD